MLKDNGAGYVLPGWELIVTVPKQDFASEKESTIDIVYNNVTTVAQNEVKHISDFSVSHPKSTEDISIIGNGWSLDSSDYNWSLENDAFTGHVETHGMSGTTLAALAVMINNYYEVSADEALKLARELYFSSEQIKGVMSPDGKIQVKDNNTNIVITYKVDGIALNTSHIVIGKIIPQWTKKDVDVIVYRTSMDNKYLYYAEVNTYDNPLLLTQTNVSVLDTAKVSSPMGVCEDFVDMFGNVESSCSNVNPEPEIVMVDDKQCVSFIDSFGNRDIDCK